MDGGNVPITTILSDVGNVVARYDNAKAVAAIAVLADVRPEAVRGAIFDGSPSPFKKFMRGDFGRGEFCSLVGAMIGVQIPSVYFEEAFGDVFTLTSEVADGWLSLRRDLGVTITAVSNMDPIRWEALGRLGVPQLFDRLVLSYEEKLIKPSEELLRRALDRSGAKAEETLFVDDQERNLPPAAALGIATHLYTDPIRLWEAIGRVGIRLPFHTS